jgi:hypothetical protein
MDTTYNEDWLKITANNAGKLRIWLESPADSDFDLKVYSDNCITNLCSSVTSGDDICTIDAAAGATYKIKNYRYSGSGDGAVRAYLEECFEHNDCADPSKPYCSAENKCVECFVDTDCKGIDGTYNTYCPKDTTVPNYILPSCQGNICRCASSCAGNVECAPNFCCTKESPQGPNKILPGKTLYTCEPEGTTSNPWLCT